MSQHKQRNLFLTNMALDLLICTFLDRIRLYVGAWDVASFKSKFVDPDTDMHGMELSEVPTSVVMPGIADIFLTVGFIGGSVFIYLLATRIIPTVNVWERKEYLLYKAEIQFHRAKVLVLGKPR